MGKTYPYKVVLQKTFDVNDKSLKESLDNKQIDIKENSSNTNNNAIALQKEANIAPNEDIQENIQPTESANKRFSNINYYLLISVIFIAMLISITFLDYTGFITYTPNELEFIGPFNLSNNVSIMLKINDQEYSKQLVLDEYNVTIVPFNLSDFNLNLTTNNYTIDAYLIDNDIVRAIKTLQISIISDEPTNITENITQPLENITQIQQIIIIDEQNNVVQTNQTLINNCTNIELFNKLINKLIICKVTNKSLIYSEPKSVVQPDNITFTKVYILDSTNFSNLDLYSKANNNMLFKCNWNFKINSCSNPWRTIQNLTINQEYNINLTNEISAFAEGNIIALQNITNKNETCQLSWILDNNWDLNNSCIYTNSIINLNKGNLTIFDSGSLTLEDYSNLSVYMLNITRFNSTKSFALNLSKNSKINISKK